jgi:hypothetical protein
MQCDGFFESNPVLEAVERILAGVEERGYNS